MIKPLRDKIIVKPAQRFQSEFLDLSQVQGVETVGFVVAVGPEAEDVGLNVGDKVHFGTVAADVGNEVEAIIARTQSELAEIAVRSSNEPLSMAESMPSLVEEGRAGHEHAMGWTAAGKEIAKEIRKG